MNLLLTSVTPKELLSKMPHIHFTKGLLVEYCRTSKLDTPVALGFKNLEVMIAGVYYLVRILLWLSIFKFYLF